MATSIKTSSQNITLHYRKSFAIIPSRSRRTMRARNPKNKSVRAVSDWRFSAACSSCRQNLKFGDLTSSLRREPQKYELKPVPYVQHHSLCCFNQRHHCVVAFSSTSSLQILNSLTL